jgi:hypothetical protein
VVLDDPVLLCEHCHPVVEVVVRDRSVHATESVAGPDVQTREEALSRYIAHRLVYISREWAFGDFRGGRTDKCTVTLIYGR